MGKYINLLSEELREDIEEYIDRNQLKPGDKLPSERELAKMLGANRITVRDALRQMRYENLIYTVHGRGNFISKPYYIEDAKNFISYTAGWTSDGYEVTNRLISLNIIEADKKIAEHLEIAIGTEVYQIKRVRLLDGMELFLETAHIPTAYCPKLESFDFEKCSLYSTLEQFYQIKLIKQKHVISITKLTAPENHFLRASEGTAAFLIHGVTFDTENRPVEYCVSLNRADRYAMSSKLIL